MKRKKNSPVLGDLSSFGESGHLSSPKSGSRAGRAARRLLDLLLGSGMGDKEVNRGRLLLEPLESRQMLAGDVDFLATDGVAPYSISTASQTQFSTSNLTAEGEPANNLVAFAKALDDAGVTFYGAAWCRFCTQQKELFQDGGKYLPFVEVTNPDRTLNSIGIAENIETFPTWVFQDGSRATGLLSLTELSTRSGIPIPQGENPYFSRIGNQTVQVNSPLHIPIDAYDPNDTSLTVTVSVADPSLLQASVLQGNRSARISVEHWGDMVFELFEDRAPRAASRFIELAQSGFYNKTTSGQILFHRVLDNFVLQAGESTPSGSGGSTLGTFDDQFHPDLQHNRTGVLSYAKSLDDTSDSQFFITEGPQRHLDFNHSIFGQLIEGDDVREAISGTAVTNSRPTTNVGILDVEIFQDTENSVLMLKPTGTRFGQTDVTVTVTDGDGNSYSEVFTVSVVAAQHNSAPYLKDIPPVSTPAGVPAVFTIEGVDVEGDPMVYEARVIDNSGASATVNQATGQVTVTPAPNFSGEVRVEVAVRRASTPTSTVASTRASTMDIQEVRVNVGPAAPTRVSLIAASDTGLSNSDGITNTAPITFRVEGVQPGAVVEVLSGDTQIGIGTATSTIASITTNNFAALGNVTHVVTARQRVNGVTSAKSPSISVTYDTVPPATVSAIPSQALVGIAYTANLQSPEEGSGLRYSRVSGPTGLVIDPITGVINWTPTSAQVGAQELVVRLTDAAGNSTEQTFTINVGEDPLLRIRVEITDISGAPVSSLTPGTEFRVRVFGSDLRPTLEAKGIFALYTDLLFDPTLAEAITPNPIIFDPAFSNSTSGTVGAGIIDEAGGFSTQSSFQNGQERLIFSVRMRALAGGSLTVSASPATDPGREIGMFDIDEAVPASRVNYGSATVAINATYSVVNDSATVNEDSTATSIPVLANDTINVPGTTLTIASVQTTSAQGGTVSISGANVLYRPAANFNGVDTFTYTARDQAGNQQTGTVTVTVQPVNDPPSAVNDSFSVAANSTQNLLDVLANDSFAPDVNETLRVTAVGTTSNGGTVTIGPNGANIRYSPATGFLGIETFTYTISDGSLTSTATVSVNIGGPTVGNDSFTIAEDAAQAEYNVLQNDTAANSNVTLSIQSVATPANGVASVTSNGTRVSYRPNPNFFGTDTFTYTVVDSNGATAVGTVTFTVTAVNDPPPAPNQSVDVIKASTSTTVLTIESLRSLNVDGTAEVINFTQVGTTQNGGTVSIGGNGQSVLYTPPSASYTGPDSFTYTVTDAGGLTSSGTITIDVVDFTPLDYLVQFDGASASTLSNSGALRNARLVGTDFRGNPVNTPATLNGSRLQFLGQPPGEYQVQLPSMPFLVGHESSTSLPFSTTVSDTTVAPLSVTLGSLHARFLSIRDFAASAPKSFVFVAVRPGESQVWLLGTDNANTPRNVAVSLSSDGNSVTVQIDDPAVTNGRRSATIPIGTSSVIDHRGETDGYRLLKINVDQSIQSIRDRFTPVTTASSTGASASSLAAPAVTTASANAEGEADLAPQTMPSTSDTTFESKNTVANNQQVANGGFTTANASIPEGEWFGAPLTDTNVSSANGVSATGLVDSDKPSETLTTVNLDFSEAVDSAMLDLLPALELRSATAEALAEGDDGDHSANVDETLKLLGD